MYLTRIKLELNSKANVQLISDCQKMHSFIMLGFPVINSKQARSEMSILYQLKIAGPSAAIYVQSKDEPNLMRYEPAEAETKDISSLHELLHEGDILRFSLFANPTVRKKMNPNDRNSKRIFIGDREKREEWLNRKLADGGAELLQADEGTSETIRGQKANGQIEAIGIHWTGLLRIRDAEEFWKTITNGIGSEKAYGMGMLMLQRY